MRQDAQRLLDRLSRKGFKYREFDDPFAELELWPIFEAMLTDERVVGEPRDTSPETNAPPRPEVSRGKRGKTLAEPARGGLFGRYATTPEATSRPAQGVNLRQFLGRLSDQD